MKQVAVIGGGAAGMTAAIAAAYNGASVVIIEHGEKLGKKILATGNGRCNFTNVRQEPECYRSENPDFPWKVLKKFGVQETVSFFLKLGIYSRNRNGYLYPHSDQASAVQETLQTEVNRLGIEVMTETECLEICPKKSGFVIRTNHGTVRADRVVLSAGSKAAPSTGSDGSGYQLAKMLGHRIVPVLPALVQLRCEGKFFKKIAGVRVQGKVALYADEAWMAEDIGEIQLTQYGISGIPVFQVSRYAACALREKKNVKAVLDFMPDFEKDTFLAFLHTRIQQRPQKRLDEFFTGLFHKKLSAFWITCSRIDPGTPVGKLKDADISRLAVLVKSFSLRVTETNSFEQAQVCCGGIDTQEVDPETLESSYIPGLYFAGEILDVDGMCGGYNLQWAWSSGFVAGSRAAGCQDEKADREITEV